ncbi:DUF4344 domain-containing metallopeptidase [Mycobacterium sp. 4D054]|uniref:DUF4344 domain-containing metallopeptidase n=1 Tax=Mycobacterium sp. 4D054 TaxID=3457440 RepID=UPI003FD3B64E
MRRGVVPVMASGLLVVGCAGAPEPPQAADPDVDSAPQDSGSMLVTYEDADSPEAIRGRKLLQDAQLLEDMADDLNQSLILPYDIALTGAQCDEANAYWDADAKSITICYEDVSTSEDIFAEAGDPDPAAAAVNAAWATFYHEVGHMAITVYDLPITGREEDVADQLAAYVLLQPGEDGQADPGSVQAVKDFAWVFGASGAERGAAGEADFADVHTLDEARMYNLQCWIYGSDPQSNADLVGDGQLPADRAEGCEDEWSQLDNAWSTLLDPHFR